MAKKNRECLTCGTQYSYCPNCNRKEPSWMADFHSENCKNIFQICTQFNVGLLTKEGAQEALKECDLANKENFKACIKRDFSNIFDVEEQPKKRGKRVEVVPVDEFANLHEVVTENE